MRVEVKAQTDGTLSLLHVETGEKVAAGETVAEAESMKMMYAIEAPANGTLFWLTPLGAVIGEGDVLAEIETEGGSDDQR